MYKILLFPIILLSAETERTRDGHVKNFLPPPAEHLTQHRHCLQSRRYANDSNINCHAAKFVPSNGYFQPCNRHSHCYQAREPTDWCIMGPNYKWTNWGCHCDKKLRSCVIERYDLRNRELQWGYCTPNTEYYCATWMKKIN